MVKREMKKKRKEITMNKSIYLLGCLLLSTTTVLAQPGSNNNISEDIVVESDKDLNIANPFKLIESPQFRDSVVPPPNFNYGLVPKRMETEFKIDTIKAAKLKGPGGPLDRLYKGYVKAGVGTSTTPLFDLYYNSLRSRKQSIGAHAKHFSTRGGIPDVGFSGFSENEINLWGKQFMREHSIKVAIDYNRIGVHHYGFLEADTVIDKKDIKQRFNSFGIGGEVSSYFKDSSRINHNVKLYYNNYSDINSSKEHNMLLDADFRTFFNSEQFILETALDYNSYQRYFTPLIDTDPSEETTINNGILKLTPKIATSGDNWMVRVGLGVYANMSRSATFHFYPDAEAKYSLFDDIFIPYAGVTGGIKRNSFRSLSTTNPFVLSKVNLLNTNQKYELYGGIRGTISSTTSFNVKVASSTLRDRPYFVNDTTYSIENQFEVRYDTVNITAISGEISYHKSEKLTFYLRGDFYDYKPKTDDFAWDLPDYQFTLSTVYDLEDKLLARLDVFMVGERVGKTLTGLQGNTPIGGEFPVTLDSYVDVNFGLEYRYTKRLSAFINFNNIAAKRYQKWNKYPVQGFNALGGITYSF